ncbi:MAG TPA: protein kinase [Clostridiaceae bacterium]|nr:protein kinase [Clostridiaceae bacterium]
MNYCNFCMNPIEDNEIECSFCGKGVTNQVFAHHLTPGTVLNKKYYVGASLGEGGFGITYIGRDITLDLKVAIKEYYPAGYVNRNNTVSLDVQDSETQSRKDFFVQGKTRFLEEARILAKFSGEPGIVNVRDFFEENNTAYIVMEYLEGETLKEYLKVKKVLTPEQTLNLMMPIMLSLKEVHKQGLIHRDISPDNIMLVGNNVKLLDFGSARNVTAIANRSLSVMLKPGYAPEEQYRSKGNQGAWTDVYAICATMYKCITGITPDDSTQRVYKDELKTPTALGIVINPDIEHALMKGLAILQIDRYQNIEQLLDGFRGIDRKINQDDKITVNPEYIVSEDDQETQYIDPGKSAPETEETEAAIHETSSAAYNLTSNAEHVKPESISETKPKKKRVRVIAVSTVLLIVVIVGIFILINKEVPTAPEKEEVQTAPETDRVPTVPEKEKIQTVPETDRVQTAPETDQENKKEITIISTPDENLDQEMIGKVEKEEQSFSGDLSYTVRFPIAAKDNSMNLDDAETTAFAGFVDDKNNKVEGVVTTYNINDDQSITTYNGQWKTDSASNILMSDMLHDGIFTGYSVNNYDDSTSVYSFDNSNIGAYVGFSGDSIDYLSDITKYDKKVKIKSSLDNKKKNDPLQFLFEFKTTSGHKLEIDLCFDGHDGNLSGLDFTELNDTNIVIGEASWEKAGPNSLLRKDTIININELSPDKFKEITDDVIDKKFVNLSVSKSNFVSENWDEFLEKGQPEIEFMLYILRCIYSEEAIELK